MHRPSRDHRSRENQDISQSDFATPQGGDGEVWAAGALQADHYVAVDVTHDVAQADADRSAKRAAMAGAVAILAGLVIAVTTDSDSDDLFKMLAWGWAFIVFAAEITWLKMFWGQGIQFG